MFACWISWTLSGLAALQRLRLIIARQLYMRKATRAPGRFNIGRPTYLIILYYITRSSYWSFSNSCWSLSNYYPMRTFSVFTAVVLCRGCHGRRVAIFRLPLSLRSTVIDQSCTPGGMFGNATTRIKLKYIGSMLIERAGRILGQSVQKIGRRLHPRLKIGRHRLHPRLEK